MPPVECGKTLSDLRAAADALRHQGQLIDCPRNVAIAQRRGNMSKSGMEDEGFRLAESIDDPVQKANEERGVKTHGAGRVEQEHEAQRPDLAAAPGEVHQCAAMRNIAMNGPAQIEPAAAPMDALAPHEPGAHHPRKPCRERMCLCNIRRIYDMAQVGTGKVFEPRSALAPAAAVTGGISFVEAPLDAIGKTRRSRPRPCVLEMPRRCTAFARDS